MNEKGSPLFLERHSYRQRRVVDAARLLPLLGCCLFLVPVLWPQGDGGVSTSTAMLYVFGVWLFLAVCAMFLSVKLERSVDGDSDAADDESGAP